MTETPQAAIRIRVARYRNARVDHYFMRGAVIRRFVILTSKSLRAFLEKQRRTEIDPLDFSEANAEMALGDFWEMAERTAKELLRELYLKVAEAKAAKSAQTLERKREATQRALGRQLVPTLVKTDATGTLIFAGVNAANRYCVDLQTPDGEVRRVEGVDLARALEVSGADVGDKICVTKAASRSVDVVEQRTGSHGRGKHKRRSSRVLFEITKEENHEPTHSGGKHGSRSSTGAHTDDRYASM